MGIAAVVLISLVAILLLGLLVFMLRRVGKSGSMTWFSFYNLCRGKGLVFQEMLIFHEVIKKTRVNNPATLFSSLKALDKVFSSYVQAMRRSKIPPAQRELRISQIMGIRRKFEFTQSKYQRGIDNTYSIKNGQPLRISVEGVGYFHSTVIDRNSSYIICAFPQGEKAENLRWKGRRVGIYFWRENDAGYNFMSEVLSEIRERDLRVLFIEHSRKLNRNQKRRYLRLDCSLEAQVTPIVIHQQGGKRVARVSKLKKFSATISNLSSNGMAMEMQHDPGDSNFLHVEFELDSGDPIRLIAKVIGAKSRRQATGLYRLSLQVVRIDLKMKNDILLYVYKYQERPAF